MATSTRWSRSPVTRRTSIDHGSPFELEAQLGEKGDSGIKRFHHDADVVHPLNRHAAISVRKIIGVREAAGSGVRASGWTSVQRCPLTIRQDPRVARAIGKVGELLSEEIAGAARCRLAWAEMC